MKFYLSRKSGMSTSIWKILHYGPHSASLFSLKIILSLVSMNSLYVGNTLHLTMNTINV